MFTTGAGLLTGVVTFSGAGLVGLFYCVELVPDPTGAGLARGVVTLAGVFIYEASVLAPLISESPIASCMAYFVLSKNLIAFSILNFS